MTGCCDNKGCCNNSAREEREVPDGLDPCCSVSGQRCLCLPYDDPWLISAQILTIASLFFGWVLWATFFVSFIGLAIFQVLWCTRMRGGPLYGHAVVAGCTAVGHLIVAIYVLVAWRKSSWCEPWIFYADDHDDYWRLDDRYRPSFSDYCAERTWFAIALVCALMWFAAAWCMFWFVKSGRHAKWEAKYIPSKGDVEITDQEGPVVADAAVVDEPEKVDDV